MNEIIRPELTIAIPTYNRAEKLAHALEVLVKYSSGLNVEILVSDNASTDKTEEIVKCYKSIRYYKNKENLGFDGNFLNCYERAIGKYVWLLSDDDELLPGAIESVLDGCKERPVCMHLNSSTLISENPCIVSKARLENNGLLKFRDKNLFIKKIGIYCTFISSLVFNVDYVKKIKNKEKYFNTNILQSHILFEIMRNEGVYIVNTFNCIAARGNKVVHYDIFRTWVKSYSELLLLTAPACGFDAERMMNVLKEDLDTTVFGFVIKFRQTCKDEKSWDRDCIWPYINMFPELVDKYKQAVNCPIWKLKLLQIKNKFRNMIKRFV